LAVAGRHCDDYVGLATAPFLALFEPIPIEGHTQECEFCGTAFEPKSSLAQFCSNACRLKARTRRQPVGPPNVHEDGPRTSVPTSGAR
jgi:hypothetical protein